jgi:hypothetical protein
MARKDVFTPFLLTCRNARRWFSVSFPCVCPEPVLVKHARFCSMHKRMAFLLKHGGVFRTDGAGLIVPGELCGCERLAVRQRSHSRKLVTTHRRQLSHKLRQQNIRSMFKRWSMFLGTIQKLNNDSIITIQFHVPVAGLDKRSFSCFHSNSTSCHKGGKRFSSHLLVDSGGQVGDGCDLVW